MSAKIIKRMLVVNADDFGQSIGVNDGILRCYREGILTSASLMVLMPAAEDAVRRGADIPMGLHLDLGEWEYSNGEWRPRYTRVPLDDAAAVAAEVYLQLEQFQRLTGLQPTHVDSHQHVHLDEPIRAIARRVAKEFDVPLRRCSPSIRYCGRFYGQTGNGAPCPDGITAEALVALLEEMPNGVTELACHPGEDAELESTYRVERFQETRSLCDPRVRQAVIDQRIELCSFSDLKKLSHTH